MKYTNEQLEQARNTDLVNMLSSYGYSFKKAGNYYRCREHNSLVIYPDRKGFCWNSRNLKGASAVDWFINVESMNFAKAVGTILDKSLNLSPAQTQKLECAKHLQLPKRESAKYTRAFAYLFKTRCIAPVVIQKFMRSHQIYQDTKGNCVFVGFDEKNEPRFACIRGTLSNKQYRGDCKGSDKQFAFSMDGTNKQKLYIFESPIDLLSHCTITNEHFRSDTAFLVHSRLALSGTSDVALEHYLKTHPEIRELNFRLDNDGAGHKATEELMDKYSQKGYAVHCLFSKEKDINADLVKKTAIQTIVKRTANVTKSPHIARKAGR